MLLDMAMNAKILNAKKFIAKNTNKAIIPKQIRMGIISSRSWRNCYQYKQAGTKMREPS
jgi:hypothetical protein